MTKCDKANGPFLNLVNLPTWLAYPLVPRSPFLVPPQTWMTQVGGISRQASPINRKSIEHLSNIHHTCTEPRTSKTSDLASAENRKYNCCSLEASEPRSASARIAKLSCTENPSNIYRTSTDSLSNTYRTFIEHLSNIYRFRHCLWTNRILTNPPSM